MASPSDHWAPYSSRRERVLGRLRYRRDVRHLARERRPIVAPLWWEPLAVLALCALLGWASWYVAFGGWR